MANPTRYWPRFILSLSGSFVLSLSKDESFPPACVILARESIVTVAGFLYSPPARSMPLSSRLPSSIGGLVLTALLAIPFAIIGPALFYRILWTVTTATTRQAWPTVPATLQRVELVPAGGSTVRVSASYTYAVAGHQYTSTHVSLYGPDSPGGAQSKAYDELKEYVARDAPYPAHVNPADPSDAILMPVIRWQTIGFMSLFATVFGGVGWGLLIACVQTYFKRNAEAALIAQHPNEPWLQRLEWTGPRIQSDQESLASGTLIAAIMWNLFSAPMLIAVPEKLRQREWIGVLLLVFPAVGVFLIYWAGVSIMRARRFGKTFLDLETRPGRQGEHLRGRIFAPAALGSASAVDLVVACVQDPKECHLVAIQRHQRKEAVGAEGRCRGFQGASEQRRRRDSAGRRAACRPARQLTRGDRVARVDTRSEREAARRRLRGGVRDSCIHNATRRDGGAGLSASW